MFLHGYLSSKEAFTYQIDYFSKRFKVFAPDFSGFRRLDLTKAYSVLDYACEIELFLNEIGERVDLVAHSFGTRVLLKLLPNDKIDRIIITGGAGLKTKQSFKTKFKKLVYKFVKRVFHKEIKRFESKDLKMLPPIMKESFKKIVNETFDEKLSFIENKTLIIYGENDLETPKYLAEKFNKGIKNSQLVFIKDAGHFAFIDKPQEFNVIVKEFLNDV